MKKTLLIIMSIAILGALGLYINKKPAISANPTTQTTAIGSTAQSSSSANNSSNSATNSSGSSQASGSYKDGTYTGSAVDNLYGTVQVAAVISGGKITDIRFLQMPSDQENSRVVASFAEPQLKQETLAAQSTHIDFVSGATQDSQSYIQSLQAALDQATQA